MTTLQTIHQHVLRYWSAPGRTSAPAVFFAAALVSSAAGVLFFAAYWLVNLNRAFGGRLAWLDGLLRGSLPETWFQLLDGLSRDASTVTSMIGLILSFYVLRAALGYFFRPAALPDQMAVSRESFPFPLRYQITWVQLGLLGTLWSFLLIGNQLKLGMDPVESVTILVTAFGTALLSTFAGVVGAYIVAPLVAIGCQRACAAAGLRARTTSGALDELKAGIEALSRSNTATARLLAPETAGPDSSRSLQESAMSVCQALDELERQLTAVDLQGPLSRAVDQLVDQIGRKHEEHIDRLEVAMTSSMTALGENLRRGLESLGPGIERGHATLAKELLEGLSNLVATFGKNRNAERKTLEARLDTHAQNLQAGHERLERSVERLKKPIEQLRKDVPGWIEARYRELAKEIGKKIDRVREDLEHQMAERLRDLHPAPSSPDTGMTQPAKAEAGRENGWRRWRSFLAPGRHLEFDRRLNRVENKNIYRTFPTPPVSAR